MNFGIFFIHENHKLGAESLSLLLSLFQYVLPAFGSEGVLTLVFESFATRTGSLKFIEFHCR